MAGICVCSWPRDSLAGVLGLPSAVAAVLPGVPAAEPAGELAWGWLIALKRDGLQREGSGKGTGYGGVVLARKHSVNQARSMYITLDTARLRLSVRSVRISSSQLPTESGLTLWYVYSASR